MVGFQKGKKCDIAPITEYLPSLHDFYVHIQTLMNDELTQQELQVVYSQCKCKISASTITFLFVLFFFSPILVNQILFYFFSFLFLKFERTEEMMLNVMLKLFSTDWIIITQRQRSQNQLERKFHLTLFRRDIKKNSPHYLSQCLASPILFCFVFDLTQFYFTLNENWEQLCPLLSTTSDLKAPFFMLPTTKKKSILYCLASY